MDTGDRRTGSISICSPLAIRMRRRRSSRDFSPHRSPPRRSSIASVLAPAVTRPSAVIDPNLKRPITDEYVIGIESERRGWLRVGLTGIARREANLIGVVDVGVPLTSYGTVGIPDPGHDFASSEDDRILIAYNRLPASYGRNEYMLTNSGEPAATAFGLKLWAEGSTDKLAVLFGATASAANGSAASRGYGPLENDQDIVGELRTDPNASTFARGRCSAIARLRSSGPRHTGFRRRSVSASSPDTRTDSRSRGSSPSRH